MNMFMSVINLTKQQLILSSQLLFKFYFFPKCLFLFKNMFMKHPKKSFLSKCKELLQKPSLIFGFQTETIKLLVYNYVIVMLIANQEIGWNYPFKGVCCSVSASIYQKGFQRRGANMETAIRYGQELIEPAIQSKFGFFFRLLTVVVNTLAIFTVFCPTRGYRKFLLLPILWNFYTVTAIAENILEIVWTMFMLEVPFMLFSTIFLVGLFVISLQSKLTLQVLRFYEHLNYVP